MPDAALAYSILAALVGFAFGVWGGMLLALRPSRRRAPPARQPAFIDEPDLFDDHGAPTPGRPPKPESEYDSALFSQRAGL